MSKYTTEYTGYSESKYESDSHYNESKYDTDFTEDVSYVDSYTSFSDSYTRSRLVIVLTISVQSGVQIILNVIFKNLHLEQRNSIAL